MFREMVTKEMVIYFPVTVHYYGILCTVLLSLNIFSILNSTVKNLHGTSVPMCGKETSQPLCIKNIQSTMYFHEAVINRSGCRSQVSWCSVTSDLKPDFLF